MSAARVFASVPLATRHGLSLYIHKELYTVCSLIGSVEALKRKMNCVGINAHATLTGARIPPYVIIMFDNDRYFLAVGFQELYLTSCRA